MATLSLQHIGKTYGKNVEAVKDFNLEIRDSDFIILVGPSGCGKSTTLRMIAGLESITTGNLYMDGKWINHVDEKDRDMAMIFQNYALYPHLTVYENMAFGLRMRKVAKNEIEKTIAKTAKILNLENLLDRKPKALSGGEKQRVAMGRAIVREPKVFLMDEPLSNLDAKLRVQMRAEITKLHKRLGTTIIYVTHDQVEAMTLGTKIVVMDKGIIQQVDTPENLYDYPCNVFVAGFIGAPQMNFIMGKLVKKGGLYLLESEDDCFTVPANAVLKHYLGDQIIMGIRPEDLIIYNEINHDTKIGVIELKEVVGAEVYLHVKLKNLLLMIRAPRNSYIEDSNVIFSVKMENIHLFDAKTLKRIN